jgi:preprotein translocase subunit SecD
MTNRLRLLLILALCVFVLAAVACSSSDDGPTATPFSSKGRAIVHVEIPTPAASSSITAVQTALKARLDAAGITATLTPAAGEQITIDFANAPSLDFVTDVVTASGLRFKVADQDGTAIKCKDTSGNDFTIPPESLSLSGNLPVCVSADGRNGEVQWKPAVGNVGGTDTELTGAMIPKSQVGVVTPSPGSQGNVALNADFDAQGKAVLAAVTANLKGYPLGVFLGDSLIVAPQIQRQIENGRITLAGASPDVLNEIEAVVKGGELPSPVTLVSIEQQ